MPGRARVAAESSVAFFARGRAVAVHHAAGPAALRAAAAARARAHGRGRGRAAALRERPRAVRARDRARLDRALDGPRRVATRCGARCCAASSARAPTTSRWSGCGASCALRRQRGRAPTSGSATRARSWEPLFDALRARDRGARRPRADRPPGGADRARDGGGCGSRPGAPGSFRAGHDPRAFDARRRARALRRASSPPCPTTSSSGCSTRARRRAGGGYLARLRAIEYFTALCLLLEVDRRFTPLLLDQRGRPRAAVRRA